ncbi:MAG: Tripartite-type tricarboxylate transporter, receptor component TctC [Hyphomicrobiales bacterium]|nr:Tripartite-type tricarboxylate transporter, receptor component TctC [Hyphomicrobiales bacterium]
MRHVMSAPLRVLAFAAVAGAPAGAAFAQSEGYFKGKPVIIAVGGTAGGGIDIGARMMSRYIGKHLPGEPNVQVQLMPGAGGVRLVEYLYSVAPRDGTYIGAFATGPLIEPLISTREVKYKISDFTAVGALENDVSFCTTWHTSPIKTIEDAKAKEVTVAGTGAASSTDIFPLALNATLGTKFRIISGYVGTQETIMAIERGETDGRCGWGWSSLKSSKPDWMRDKKLNFIVQLGLKKHPEAMDVPLALDLIPDEAGKQMMRVLVAPQAITRPYLAPPGMPAERTKEVRAAFMAALNEPALRAEFSKIMGEEPSPTNGADMQKLLEEMYNTPPAVVARLKEVLKTGK